MRRKTTIHKLDLVNTHNTAPVDSAQNARTVREDTAELASYLLSDSSTRRRPAFLQRSRGSIQDVFAPEQSDCEFNDENARHSDAIPELSEPPSPDARLEAAHGGVGEEEEDGPSVLSNLLKRSPPQSVSKDVPSAFKSRHESPDAGHLQPLPVAAETRSHRAEASASHSTEHTPLLPRQTSDDTQSHLTDLEGQASQSGKKWFSGLVESGYKMEHRVSHAVRAAANPAHWNAKSLWQNVVLDPVSCLPAVAVGLLLNILDALSYGEFGSNRGIKKTPNLHGQA